VNAGGSNGESVTFHGCRWARADVEETEPPSTGTVKPGDKTKIVIDRWWSVGAFPIIGPQNHARRLAGNDVSENNLFVSTWTSNRNSINSRLSDQPDRFGVTRNGKSQTKTAAFGPFGRVLKLLTIARLE